MTAFLELTAGPPWRQRQLQEDKAGRAELVNRINELQKIIGQQQQQIDDAAQSLHRLEGMIRP